MVKKDLVKVKNIGKKKICTSAGFIEAGKIGEATQSEVQNHPSYLEVVTIVQKQDSKGK